ncbi:MAG TPA: hypothetical protein VF316_03855 [Polyangiaceae bacterium]
MTRLHGTKVFAWLLGALLLAGCDDSVTSQLTVNAAPFEPTSCRSGQDREFLGADLQDEAGRTLRLVVEPDDTATVILIPEEGKGSVTFKGCGVVSVDKSDNDKNGDYTVDGSTDLRCHTDGWSVVGSAQFDSCGPDY